jgi:C-terminal processing protease CtpA/Prc
LTEVDGIIGYQILRQFVITFDYSRGEAWFERSRTFGTKTVQWKTGFQAVKANGSDFQVVTVLPDSPAAGAGISVGDVITEVDGRPATSVGQAEFGDLMRRHDGTLVRLNVVQGGKKHSIVLTLKELLR